MHVVSELTMHQQMAIYVDLVLAAKSFLHEDTILVGSGTVLCLDYPANTLLYAEQLDPK
jgi:hypothetical protein